RSATRLSGRGPSETPTRGPRCRCAWPRAAALSRELSPSPRLRVELEVQVLEVANHHVDVELAAAALTAPLPHPPGLLGSVEEPPDRLRQPLGVARLDQ